MSGVQGSNLRSVFRLTIPDETRSNTTCECHQSETEHGQTCDASHEQSADVEVVCFVTGKDGGEAGKTVSDSSHRGETSAARR